MTRGVRARRLMLIAALVAMSLGLASAAQASAAFLAPCAPKSPEQCGRLAVPLDPTGAVKGTVSLAVRRLPAQGPSRGTVLLLAGGPGQAAIPVLSAFYKHYQKVLSAYDVVTFDQRGTGMSGQLTCGKLASPHAINRCGRSLGSGIGLYTTVTSAADIERVRLALGGPRLTLVGVSYGGRVANEYARIYPGHTAALVLDSPSPLAGEDPFGRERAAALPRVLDGLRIGTYANLVRTVRRLGGKGRRVAIVTPTGRKARARLTTAAVYGLVVGASDLNPALRGELPAALASAAAGDFARLARLAEGGGATSAEKGISEPLFLATNCAENAGLPWSPAASPTAKLAGLRAALATIPPSAFAPFSSKLSIEEQGILLPCLSWPSTPPSPPVTSPAGGVRALVISGDDDLRTPYETTRTVVAGLPGATLVRVPTVGHSVLTSDTVGCGMTAFGAFLQGAPVAACPVKARRLFPLLALAPRRLVALRSLRKRVALTLRGSAATVNDALLDAATQMPTVLIHPASSRKMLRFGGLRGGVVALHGRTLTLRGDEVLIGLRVTGTLRIGYGGSLSGRVFVSGPTAAPGTLVFSHGRVIGRLGGRRVGLAGALVPAAASGFSAEAQRAQAGPVIP